MRVVMVARDVAPSSAFGKLGVELEKRGVEVVSFLGGGKDIPLKNGLDAAIFAEHPCVVLVGMSSSEALAKEEIGAAEAAMQFRNPYGFYADLFGTSGRGWFGAVRENASFVFVLSEEEARKTRLLFPNAEVVVSGNPVLEDAFNVSKPNAEVRALLGVGSEDLLMYCTAGKDRETNRANFKGIVEAVSRLPERHRWKVFFMLHPGDQNDLSVYVDIAQAEGVYTRLVPAKETKAMGLAALDAIGACDLMVASVSTSGIEAACQRKPVIDNLPPLSVARMKEQTGSDVWPPCEFGVSRPVMGDPVELAAAIQDLMSPGGFDEMRARQEACFPVPETRGAAVKIMTETLLKFLG